MFFVRDIVSFRIYSLVIIFYIIKATLADRLCCRDCTRGQAQSMHRLVLLSLGALQTVCVFYSSCIDCQNSALIATLDSLDIPNLRHLWPRNRGTYDPSRRRAGVEHHLGSIPSCNTRHKLASRRRSSRTDSDHGSDWDLS